MSVLFSVYVHGKHAVVCRIQSHWPIDRPRELFYQCPSSRDTSSIDPNPMTPVRRQPRLPSYPLLHQSDTRRLVDAATGHWEQCTGLRMMLAGCGVTLGELHLLHLLLQEHCFYPNLRRGDDGTRGNQLQHDGSNSRCAHEGREGGEPPSHHPVHASAVVSVPFQPQPSPSPRQHTCCTRREAVRRPHPIVAARVCDAAGFITS